jgi:hypothetical protein
MIRPDSQAEREAVVWADLLSEVHKIPADFPNYGSYPLNLPAGHWRELVSFSSRLPSEDEIAWAVFRQSFAPDEDEAVLEHFWAINWRDGRTKAVAIARAVIAMFTSAREAGGDCTKPPETTIPAAGVVTGDNGREE